LVAELHPRTSKRLNAITGETAQVNPSSLAALNLVLANASDRRSSVRCDSGSVEAVFDNSQIASRLTPFLEENGLEPCEDSRWC